MKGTQPSAACGRRDDGDASSETYPLRQQANGSRGGAVLALIGLGVGLAVVARSTQADRFPAETAAPQSLIDDFKLEDDQHKVDPDGCVNDLLLEGPRFKDGAIALAGKFPMLEGMSIMGSAITDEGLEKLPILKHLNRINIMAPAITDRGLLALRKMPTLQDVWLVENAKLTAAGRDSLTKTNPAVRLHLDESAAEGEEVTREAAASQCGGGAAENKGNADRVESHARRFRSRSDDDSC